MNPNVPKKFTPATLALWLDSLSYKVEGVHGKAKWCWNHPICDDPLPNFEPKVWWTSGLHSIYNGHDRLGIQLDIGYNLHIVYAWDNCPDENRAISAKCSNELIFGLPRDKAELAILSSVMKVFQTREWYEKMGWPDDEEDK